ncbi:MAG: hypothetical protein BWX93_01484 [Bacteroidetes bacterium ADurb.Bin139]|nr:MAG: hypothetical protein BWX93_01484 [Bacteroidetes bacterium ADurb.Bin139]
MLPGFDLCKHIASGNGIFFQVIGIVAQIASANIHRSVPCIEYFKPTAVNPEIILIILCVGYQQFIQAQINYILSKQGHLQE